MRTSLNILLLQNASDNRHGVTFEPQVANKSESDLQKLFHVGVPSSVLTPWESASGGVSDNKDQATYAAIAESIERFSAATVQLEEYSETTIKGKPVIDYDEWPLYTKEQRAAASFPFSAIYSEPTRFVASRSLTDESITYIPQPLILLRDDYKTGLPTSSGLAASPHLQEALLSAILELIERDALMVTWLNSIPGHRIKLPDEFQKEVELLSGDCFAFDLTPAYSPYPVVAIMGWIPQEGKKRFSLGVSCKLTYQEAMKKAYYEWHQGVFFAGIYNKNVSSEHLKLPTDANTFDDHAVFYTLHPELWNNLAIFSDKKIRKPRLTTARTKPSISSALTSIKQSFHKASIRCFYVDLTGIDAIHAGVRVVRAVSPDLAMIFAHQSWPLIHKVDTFLQRDYPKSRKMFEFPYEMPHPLG